ncbi:MAG: 50S ribosomal protein L15 [Saprospiraceae bacterium]|nr:50S ribosomal protein L15 [Saprospiraceae bacterium]
MELHNLKPAKGAVHREKRIARGEGSGHGGTATKGHKGQKARAGAKRKRGFEGGQTPTHMRLPKLGFNNIHRVEYQVYNLDQLSDLSDKYQVTTFTPEEMHRLGLCKSNAKIKILGRGEAKKGISIKVHACSQTATEKIQSAGGSVDII